MREHETDERQRWQYPEDIRHLDGQSVDEAVIRSLAKVDEKDRKKRSAKSWCRPTMGMLRGRVELAGLDVGVLLVDKV